ncbi:unnamed protein product [Cercopithifilaria johnstoni]|uniref:Uncharacterized protein n=1 Tax=Cercopithifilaria johnstoni TaxID=2874296 RepID=A0A8J2Q693_9BILA|nr:unnamed protein product [Cercopithifilaria johnstoni]
MFDTEKRTEKLLGADPSMHFPEGLVFLWKNIRKKDDDDDDGNDVRSLGRGRDGSFTRYSSRIIIVQQRFSSYCCSSSSITVSIWGAWLDGLMLIALNWLPLSPIFITLLGPIPRSAGSRERRLCCNILLALKRGPVVTAVQSKNSPSLLIPPTASIVHSRLAVGQREHLSKTTKCHDTTGENA